MKIFIACDSYKGCLSSFEVNEIIGNAAKAVNATTDVVNFCIGDGGEGTSEAFVRGCGGQMVTQLVRDAYYRPIEASYGVIEEGKTAVIEVAACIGLNKYEREQRHPLYATSYGVGELLLDASKRNVKKIILGLGGSSTNDGGMGMLQALGVKFYDSNGKHVRSGAGSLKDIHRIDITKLNRLRGIEIVVACDVKNKLLGVDGATYVFGKQKGLYPNQIKKVDKAMEHYVQLFQALGYDIATHEGSGAAGGIGSVLSLFDATFESGLALLWEYANMDEQLEACDLVITGEGQSDLQTLYGKVPFGMITLANKFQKPCICISGALGVEYNKLYDLGFIGIYSIADRAMSFAQALEYAPEKLYACAYSVLKTIDYYLEE